MDALKAQLDRIRQQLAALTATQKMLVAALVAVMVLTVLYWGKYAGNAEMVPVLDQTLSEDDIGPIGQQLKLMGVQYTVSGGKVMVPADRQGEILADLMFARVLPQDTHSAFETMSKEITPFSSNSNVEMAYTEAISMELSSIIGRFPGVSNARVIINAKDEKRIEGSIPPSATVFITARGTVENAKDMVRAAADGVAHAVSGLTPSQISVIINGASMKVPDLENDPMAFVSNAGEAREKREAALEQKIRNQFAYIPGMTVTVNCDVNIETTDEHVTKYNKDGSVSLPQKSLTNTEESTSSNPSKEPGVTSNTSGSNGSASLDSNGGGGGAPANVTNTSHEETGYENRIGSDIINKSSPAGKDVVKSAAVRVPSSYFTAIYKRSNPSAKDIIDPPADFTASTLASIRDGVKKATGIATDDQLSVDTYLDLPIPDLAMATGPSVQASTLSTVGGHAKEIGIAVLAIVSLFMMATMVRKSAPAQLVLPSFGAGPTAGGGGSATAVASAINPLGSGESVAGEVGGGAGALDGMEMDEDAVRTQQMLDQVSTMVKENPDGAANLVKKWLSRA